MKKSERITITVALGIMLLVLGVSVGYATAFSQTLNVNGTATVKQRNFVVKFKSAVSQGKITGSSAQVTSDDAVTISTPLSKPGDAETFNIAIENAGSLDAVLQGLTVGEVTADGVEASVLANLKNDLEITTSGFTVDSELTSGDTVSGTVTVAWKADSTTQYSEDITAKFTLTFDYVEKTN